MLCRQHKKLGLYFLLFISVFSCTERKKDHSNATTSAVDSNLFVVDLDHAKELKSLDFSFFFKKATCIQLDDDNGNALISYVSKLIVFNEYLYVLDTKIGNLFVFNMDGSFIRKIGSLGQGPGEYSNIMDFTINTDKNEIMLIDGHKILFFDLNGNHLKTLQAQNNDSFIYFFQYCNDLLYTSVRQFSDIKDDDCLLQSINMIDGSVENSFLNKKKHNKGWNEAFKQKTSYFISTHEYSYLYRNIFMDTIFSITNNGVHPYLVVNSKDMISEKDLVAPPNADRFEFLLANLLSIKKISDLYNFFETSDFFHFRYEKGGKGGESKNVIFNKSDRTVQKVSALQNDLVYKDFHSYFSLFCFYDKKGVYEIIENDRFFELFPLILEDKLQSPFNEQLKRLNTDSNPIIFYYEFK